MVPPWTLAVAAMLSVQLGSALSVPLIDTAGAAGTAWLRLTAAALAFLALAQAAAAVCPPGRRARAARSRREQRARHDLLPSAASGNFRLLDRASLGDDLT
jgi:hypothetical protein